MSENPVKAAVAICRAAVGNEDDEDRDDKFGLLDVYAIEDLIESHCHVTEITEERDKLKRELDGTSAGLKVVTKDYDELLAERDRAIQALKNVLSIKAIDEVSEQNDWGLGYIQAIERCQSLAEKGIPKCLTPTVPK